MNTPTTSKAQTGVPFETAILKALGEVATGQAADGAAREVLEGLACLIQDVSIQSGHEDIVVALNAAIARVGASEELMGLQTYTVRHLDRQKLLAAQENERVRGVAEAEQQERDEFQSRLTELNEKLAAHEASSLSLAESVRQNDERGELLTTLKNELDQREVAMNEREAAVRQREERVEQAERALERDEADLDNRTKVLDSRLAHLVELQKCLDRREANISGREGSFMRALMAARNGGVKLTPSNTKRRRLTHAGSTRRVRA